MKNFYFLILAICLLPFLSKASNGQILFVAKLNTTKEIPVVRGDALGLVTFMLSEDHKEILIHGVFTNLTGGVSGCHIHTGNETENGPVLVNLTGNVQGVRLKATVATPANFIQLAERGLLYINVHTASHPNGEIRGQLEIMSEIIVPVIASGLNEVPPDTNQAFALGSLRFSKNFSRLEYNIIPIELSSPPEAAHIHLGTAGVNGPVLTGLTINETINGIITDTALIKQIFTEILAENAYINIHTTDNPDGEARAQLLFEGLQNGDAILNGDQQVPPVSTTAKGIAYVYLEPAFDSLYYVLIHDGLTPVAAHIHHAGKGINGPVVGSLNLISPGIYQGKIALDDEQLIAYFNDELYFNIHTASNPDGEIRGQIINNILKAYAFDLCGDQEVPVKNVASYGAMYIAINKANTEMEYAMIINNLNGDPTTTRLYDGAFGTNGSILASLELPLPYVESVLQVNDNIVSKIEADHAYINVHNAANPTGEVRGQVRKVLSCLINTANKNANDESTLKIEYNNSDKTIIISGELNNSQKLLVSLTDLNGKQFQQWNLNQNNGIINRNLKVESILPGFYTVSLFTDHATISKKIVIR